MRRMFFHELLNCFDIRLEYLGENWYIKQLKGGGRNTFLTSKIRKMSLINIRNASALRVYLNPFARTLINGFLSLSHRVSTLYTNAFNLFSLSSTLHSTLLPSLVCSNTLDSI